MCLSQASSLGLPARATTDDRHQSTKSLNRHRGGSLTTRIAPNSAGAYLQPQATMSRLPLLRPLRPLRALRPPTNQTHHRLSSSFLQSSPAPPRLPADQQAEFERLQRAAEAALSSHNEVPSTSTSAEPSSPLTTSRHVSTPSASAAQTQAQAPRIEEDDTVSPGSLSAGMRKGAPPEFEGEKNPKTGEIGGPKNEPLRWGSAGDWSYNGRVTDF